MSGVFFGRAGDLFNTRYIQQCLPQIRLGRDPYVSARPLTSGHVEGTLHLTFGSGRQAVLKPVEYLDSYNIRGQFRHVKNLSQLSRSVTKPLGEIREDGRVFVLYEYAHPVRVATLDDVKTAFVEMLCISDQYQKGRSPIVQNDLQFIAENGFAIYDISAIRRFIPDVDSEIVETERRLAHYFTCDPVFGRKYAALPVRYIHGDLKGENTIIMAIGYKIVDWDNSMPDKRIKEIARFIMLALEYADEETVLDLFSELPVLLRRAGIRLTDEEKEMLFPYLVLSIVEADSWIFSELDNFQPDKREKFINILKDHHSFLRRILNRPPTISDWNIGTDTLPLRNFR